MDWYYSVNFKYIMYNSVTIKADDITSIIVETVIGINNIASVQDFCKQQYR